MKSSLFISLYNFVKVFKCELQYFINSISLWGYYLSLNKVTCSTSLVISLLLLILIIPSPASVIAKEIQESMSSETKETSTSLFLEPIIPSYNYVIRDPIEITQDSEFTSDNGVVNGTGTEENPFIIEGWEITFSEGTGILIADTSKYFIISNCWIGAEYRSGDACINLARVADGTATISDNICSGGNTLSLSNSKGIYLNLSNNNYLINNTCSNGYSGVYVDNSENNIIIENNCSINYQGIIVKNSNIMSRNTNSPYR